MTGDPDPKKLLRSFKSYGSRALNKIAERPASGTCWTWEKAKKRGIDIPRFVLRSRLFYSHYPAGRRMSNTRWLISALTVIAGVGGPAIADEAIDFQKQIRPILKTHCVECHGAAKQKGGLRLDAPAFATAGGEHGPSFVVGKSGQSLLIQRVTNADPARRMPPKGKGLGIDDITALKRWIDAGAKWPETAEDRAAANDSRLAHWAWQPIRQVVAPGTEAAPRYGTPRNEIDQFVRAKLRDKGLAPSPEADRATLIRRLSFDLLGLPPAPEDVEKFVKDADPLAYEKLVDRVLASPHYGERWARHWLDVAHYADTHGFERDQRRDNAWRYRDWVIKALNADMPYDQFLRDQVAGDVLRPADREAVTATGFLAAGPWDFVGQAETPSPTIKRAARADDLDDMVTQVMATTCAVTVNCARCHDHKLDPISQREYYALWAVFAGVKRGDRVVSPAEEQRLTEQRRALETKIAEASAAVVKARGKSWRLADIVGGGDGLGTGKANSGIDPATGKPQAEKRGILENAAANRFVKSSVKFVDGVVIPNGGESGEVTVSSTGLVARKVPKTTGKTWDAIRNGPINSQHSTRLGDADYSQDGTLLSLHANAGITFDLAGLGKAGLPEKVRFLSQVGYFGMTPRKGASYHVYLDGELAVERLNIGRDDGLFEIDIDVPAEARFLTLLSTDGGNDISHDQICFVHARLQPTLPKGSEPNAADIVKLEQRRDALKKELAALPLPDKVYAINAEMPTPVKLLSRGDPEQPKEDVGPGTVKLALSLPHQFGDNATTDAQRRIALANWLADPANPLPPRVIVNRLWQHHFGTGLVETPSDFGLGGGKPSHPELLDWLAGKLLQEKWSLKAMHRLICTSGTYRQASIPAPELLRKAQDVDAGNRLLWRQNARRLDAESIRDTALMTAGKLNRDMYGPGYRDFDYKEEYAPVYTYVTADKPELQRRSIYRFVVRTTPHTFMTTLDCPNPANLTPVRTVTTTALQALAMLNHDFMVRQADHFAARLQREHPAKAEAQVVRAFTLAFGRPATEAELAAGVKLVEKRGLAPFCRYLLNANEFVYID